MTDSITIRCRETTTAMSVVIIGTLDTKGEEIAFARDVVRSQGLDVHVVDTGVMGEPSIEPDTAADAVAAAADTSLDELRAAGDRGAAIEAMRTGAAVVVDRLHAEGRVDGVLGLGGSGNTSIATGAMRELPLGVPKLMLSTVASGNTEPYVGVSDVMLMNSVVDVEGVNRISEEIISNAALAMVGMAANESETTADSGPVVGITMFGVTTPCVKRARTYLEEQGYETVVFHANGTGGKALESLVREGIIDGVLDVTTTEWADEYVGGELSAGPDRLDAAAEIGVPQVVSTGALDMVNFGPRETVPERFEGRRFHVHNPEVTLMRTTPEENAAIGEIVAGKLNAASGPTALALPLQGVSMLDVEGEDFYDPEADIELFDALRTHLDGVQCIEMDVDINDEAFAKAIARRLDELMRRAGKGP